MDTKPNNLGSQDQNSETQPAAPPTPQAPSFAAASLPEQKPGRSKKWLAIAGIALIVIGVGLFLLTRPAHLNYGSTSTATTTTTQAKKTTNTGQPIDCGGAIYNCVPNVDVNRDVVPKLQAAGFSCAPESDGNFVQDCKNASTVQEIKFANASNDMAATDVSQIQLSANTGANGTNPPDLSHAAWTANVANFQKLVSIVFAAYPTVQKDMNAWVAKQTGACSYASISDYDNVDGYQLNCMPASPLSVSGSAGTVTSWTSIIHLDAPLL